MPKVKRYKNQKTGATNSAPLNAKVEVQIHQHDVRQQADEA